MNGKFVPRAAMRRRQTGLTLMKLMISITLGLIILLGSNHIVVVQ